MTHPCCVCCRCGTWVHAPLLPIRTHTAGWACTLAHRLMRVAGSEAVKPQVTGTGRHCVCVCRGAFGISAPECVRGPRLPLVEADSAHACHPRGAVTGAGCAPAFVVPGSRRVTHPCPGMNRLGLRNGSAAALELGRMALRAASLLSWNVRLLLPYL